MNANEQITRRSAAGLLLAGAALPVAKAFASHRRGVDAWAQVDANGIVVMTTFSGEFVTAWFESELLIGSRGGARGFMSFGFGDENVDYVPQLGGLEFDAAGNPVRAWVLLRERLSDGQLAQDWALASITPSASGDIYLEYDFMFPSLHHEPVRFVAPGRFEIGQR
jgi:hypothetical protein